MKTILILGATSAVAKAFARRRAAEGNCKIVLAGRKADALADIAADIKARGAAETAFVAGEIGDPVAVSALWAEIHADYGTPDEALLAYGILGDQTQQQDVPSELVALFNVNLVSAALWAEALMSAFEDAERGRLAIIGSVAGDRGRQSNYLYGATKGALERICEGLSHRAAAHRDISVTLVKPGFIDTPMTDHIEGKGGPLWAKAETIADVTARALEKRRTRVYAPWFWRYILLIIRALPVPVIHRTKL